MTEKVDEYNFQRYVEDKYSNPDGIHHYEITQLSGKQTGDGRQTIHTN